MRKALAVTTSIFGLMALQGFAARADEALDKLAKDHPVLAELVKLRYFAGMTNEEAARLLGISVSTVKNYWNFSRAWLFQEVSGE